MFSELLGSERREPKSPSAGSQGPGSIAGSGWRVPVPSLLPSHQVPSHRYRSGREASSDCHRGVSSGWSRVIFGFETNGGRQPASPPTATGQPPFEGRARFSLGNLAGTLGDAINAGGRKFSAGVGMPGSPMLPRALCRRPGALAPRRPTPDGVCRATAD